MWRNQRLLDGTLCLSEHGDVKESKLAHNTQANMEKLKTPRQHVVLE